MIGWSALYIGFVGYVSVFGRTGGVLGISLGTTPTCEHNR